MARKMTIFAYVKRKLAYFLQTFLVFHAIYEQSVVVCQPRLFSVVCLVSLLIPNSVNILKTRVIIRIPRRCRTAGVRYAKPIKLPFRSFDAQRTDVHL